MMEHLRSWLHDLGGADYNGAIERLGTSTSS